MSILVEKYGQNRSYEQYTKSKSCHLFWDRWNIIYLQKLYITAHTIMKQGGCLSNF
jgi:hypothetical protein